MPDLGLNDPLSAAVRGRGMGVYGLSTATQPGQGALDQGRDTLIDQAVSARQNFESRRQALINQLPYANHRQARGIAAELHGMDVSDRIANQRAMDEQHQLNFEATQRRIMAHEQASQLDHQLKTDRDTEIDEQGAGMMQTLGRLESALRNGQITKEQHDDALLQAGQQFPMALRHPEAARHYEFAIDQGDRYNQFTARNLERQAGKIAGRYGVDVQNDPDTGLPSIPLTQQAAMQSDRGKAEQIQMMNQEMRQKYGIGTGVSSLFNPVAPHTSPDEGKTIDLPFVDPKTQQIGKLNVPSPLFDQMKTNFQDRYFNIVPQQTLQAAPQTTATVPAAPQGAAPTQVPQIASQADYDALQPGSTFIHNGAQYQKPQPQASE